MSNSLNRTETVQVAVQLNVTVTLPAGVNGDAQATAQALAAEAASHLCHVSRARLAAFNEVHRLHSEDGAKIAAVATVTPMPISSAA